LENLPKEELLLAFLTCCAAMLQRSAGTIFSKLSVILSLFHSMATYCTRACSFSKLFVIKNKYDSSDEELKATGCGVLKWEGCVILFEGVKRTSRGDNKNENHETL